MIDDIAFHLLPMLALSIVIVMGGWLLVATMSDLIDAAIRQRIFKQKK